VESGAQTARGSLQVPGHVSFALTHPRPCAAWCGAGPRPTGAASCAGLVRRTATANPQTPNQRSMKTNASKGFLRVVPFTLALGNTSTLGAVTAPRQPGRGAAQVGPDAKSQDGDV